MRSAGDTCVGIHCLLTISCMEEASSSPHQWTVKPQSRFVNGLPTMVHAAFWCTVMPVTSFSRFRAIQGTIPAYLMAFASAGLVLASGETGQF